MNRVNSWITVINFIRAHFIILILNRVFLLKKIMKTVWDGQYRILDTAFLLINNLGPRLSYNVY